MLILVVILLIFALCWKLYRIHTYWSRKNVVQYTPWPLVGNFGSVVFQRLSIGETFNRMYKHFPNERYFGIYRFLKPGLVIRDVDLIKRIMVKDFNTFAEHRTIIPESVDSFLSKSLLFMKNHEKWQLLRSTLTPAFTTRKMRIMYPLMIKCANQFIEYYENSNGVLTLDVKNMYEKYTNDVIASTAFGVDCNSFKNPDNTFYKIGKEFVASVTNGFLKLFLHTLNPVGAKIWKAQLIPEYVINFFNTVVMEAIKQRQQQLVVRPDMIQLLTETRSGKIKYESGDNDIISGYAMTEEESDVWKQLKVKYSDVTDDDLVAQAAIFYLAGNETSANVLSFASYELAINSDIQNKLRNEIDEMVRKSNSKFVSYEDLFGMKYLDAVISESLRKWPPIQFVDRKSKTSFKIEPQRPGEKTIYFDADTDCYIPIRAVHMDPKYYPNPEKFDPDRFNDQNKHLIVPYSFLPFGLGPKNCFGGRFALLQSKLILYTILSKYEIVPVPRTLIPMRLSKKKFLLEADGGIWLGFKKRKME